MSVNYASTREKLKEICDLGLVRGEGNRDVPGQLCIESAVALALGEPYSDEPSCVHLADRAFALTLNDAPWPDPITRGQALYALGCAQLGTAGTDRTEWLRRVAEGTIRRVLPIALRTAADLHTEELHRVALRDAADKCEAEGTREAANAASDAVRYASHYAAGKAPYAAVKAVNAARKAVNAAYAAAAYAAAFYATDDVTAYARSAASASCYAANAAVLTTAVEVALDAYRAEGRA